jgi:hypothetical protein
MLILRMIANPVASWGEDFYEEPAVLYRWLGLQTLYVMDPVLIQRILLDAAENYSKQPLNDDVFGEAIGGGLLNAEGDTGGTPSETSHDNCRPWVKLCTQTCCALAEMVVSGGLACVILRKVSDR